MKNLIFTLISFLFLGISSYGQQPLTELSFNDSALYSYSIADVDQLLEIVDVTPTLSPEGRKPLFLIHGWNSNGQPAAPSGGYWDYLKSFILNDAELSANFKPYYVRYWSNYVSVKDIATELRNQVEALGFENKRIVIMGHSMGGLVSKSYMYENNFTKGPNAGQACGTMVDRLITLGTPHHGSPMGNGPARNNLMYKNSPTLALSISVLDAALFGDLKYNEVNRGDLRWDNFDALLDYEKYPDEENTWLTNLNTNTEFDDKIVLYSAKVTGKFLIPEGGNVTEEYQLGAYVQKQGLGLDNDGIVPVKSSQYEGHTVRKIRNFNEYNHTEIIIGKSDRTELFNPMKEDLLEVLPLKITWPTASNIYLKHSQNREIKWNAPETIKRVNIYFSSNGGATFSTIASNIDASLGKTTWKTPDINSENCIILIENADNPTVHSESSNQFTVFHNKLQITSPSEMKYMVRYRNNKINWEQEGLGKKVRITYTDSKNYVTRTIATEVETKIGSNSVVWPADVTIPASNTGVIQIQLLNLQEDYGDTEIYTFTSNQFKMLGDAGFQVLSPETVSSDFFGIEGEQMEIGTNYTAKWKAQGEIKYVQLLLCDEHKNILQSLGSTNNTPDISALGTKSFIVPEFYGNKFYLMAKAGVTNDSILVEAYSENTFRINKKAHIVSPASNSNEVSLLPCFTLNKIEGATGYTLYLQDTLDTDQFPAWKYHSETFEFCVPSKYENELQPGMAYQLTAVAHFDTLTSFVDQILFQTAATAPWDFSVLDPQASDTIENDQLKVIWTRAIGASEYQIELVQAGKTVYQANINSPLDTIAAIPTSELEYYKEATITISAGNAFGQTSTSQTIYRKYKTGINDILSDNIGLRNYPNPVSNHTVFEFNIDSKYQNSQVTLSIYNLSGQKLETVFEGNVLNGINRISWNNTQLPKGNYAYQLNIDGQKISKLMQIQ